MYKILDLKRVFSTFQETVWSLLKELVCGLYYLIGCGLSFWRMGMFESAALFATVISRL